MTQPYHVSDEVLNFTKCGLTGSTCVCVLCVFKSLWANVRVQTCPAFTEKTTACQMCVFKCNTEAQTHRDMKRRRYSSILMSAYSCYCYYFSLVMFCLYIFFLLLPRPPSFGTSKSCRATVGQLACYHLVSTISPEHYINT